MWGRSANLHLAQHYNALLSMMLSVYRTAVLSTTIIAIHVQRIVKNEDSQDTPTQTVLQSILIGKKSQKKHPFFWALLNLEQTPPWPNWSWHFFLLLKTLPKSLAGKEEGSIWAGYKALQRTKYKTTNCAQERTQPSAQNDVQTYLNKDSIHAYALHYWPIFLGGFNTTLPRPAHMSTK